MEGARPPYRLTVMPWTTTDEFNVIPKTQRMTLASFPGQGYVWLCWVMLGYGGLCWVTKSSRDGCCFSLLGCLPRTATIGYRAPAEGLSRQTRRHLPPGNRLPPPTTPKPSPSRPSSEFPKPGGRPLSSTVLRPALVAFPCLAIVSQREVDANNQQPLLRLSPCITPPPRHDIPLKRTIWLRRRQRRKTVS